MSSTTESRALRFIPDVLGAHTAMFRASLPHSDEFIDEEGATDPYFGMETGAHSSEDQLRIEIERDLRAQMQQQLDALQAEADRRIEEFSIRFEEQRENSVQQLGVAAAELALAAAKRVIRHELTTDSEFIVRLVEEAVSEVAASVDVVLRVHPDDAAALREQPQLLSRLRVGEVAEDPTFTPGDCVVEAGSRSWDATIESQLKELEEQVQACLESA